MGGWTGVGRGNGGCEPKGRIEGRICIWWGFFFAKSLALGLKGCLSRTLELRHRSCVDLSPVFFALAIGSSISVAFWRQEHKHLSHCHMGFSEAKVDTSVCGP